MYLIHTNWWRKFMVNSKLVVDKKSAPRLEGKRKQKEGTESVHGFPTDKNDRCVFTRDSRREVMIFFEKNKVLGVEANRVLNILWTDHLTCRGEGGYGFLFRSELEYLIFFQNITLGYMTKTLNQIIFFPPPKSEYFFQQHWESEYFFRKKT